MQCRAKQQKARDAVRESELSFAGRCSSARCVAFDETFHFCPQLARFGMCIRYFGKKPELAQEDSLVCSPAHSPPVNQEVLPLLPEPLALFLPQGFCVQHKSLYPRCFLQSSQNEPSASFLGRPSELSWLV